MQGRRDKALNILRGIFVTNTGQTKDYYPVKELMIDEKFMMPVIVTTTSNGGTDIKRPPDYDANGALCDIEAIKKKGKYALMFSNIADNSKELFVPPILKFTIISIMINFTFHIGVSVKFPNFFFFLNLIKNHKFIFLFFSILMCPLSIVLWPDDVVSGAIQSF